MPTNLPSLHYHLFVNNRLCSVCLYGLCSALFLWSARVGYYILSWRGAPNLDQALCAWFHWNATVSWLVKVIIQLTHLLSLKWLLILRWKHTTCRSWDLVKSWWVCEHVCWASQAFEHRSLCMGAHEHLVSELRPARLCPGALWVMIARLYVLISSLYWRRILPV